ncbi:melanocyte-stimulating hormone receptor-like, partial [Stylophora pistillata]|uniref:melanocyte-stimulating hormone receptor-like n=1 Tax=Stylophora pistillata TaxID=50429 RepID=UPI000C03C228
LVALHKESSLHLPSKLLYRCLAITDLLVGLVTQPLFVTYWMSVVHEHRSLCRYSFQAAFVTGHTLISVSLSTVTAISVDRPLAMLLGLRYKEIVTSRRMYIILVIAWAFSLVAVQIAISFSKNRFPNFIILRGMAVVIVFFNSTLNPFLYCWRISEVRKAVKQTIRHAICYA